jgi:membrane-bound lytic murein transglycosylase B
MCPRRIGFVAATCLASLALAAPALAADEASGGTAAGPAVTGGSPPTAPVAAKPVQQVKPGAGASDIPAAYLRLYRRAARAEGVDWRIVAAIGKSESDHGRSRARGVATGLNYARCCAGPMQFCTVKSCGNTWRAYATDGNGDGRRSVYDPADAIPAAAALIADLRALVGPRTDLILASYNAGPAYARKYHRVPPYPDTRGYVRKGLAYIAALG